MCLRKIDKTTQEKSIFFLNQTDCSYILMEMDTLELKSEYPPVCVKYDIYGKWRGIMALTRISASWQLYAKPA